MNKKQATAAAVMLAASIIFIFCTKPQKNEYQTLSIYDVFDTYSELSVSGKNADKALEECNAYLHDVNSRWSATDPNSEISKLNAAAGVSPVTLSDDTVDILDKSVRYSMDTNGFFDVTIGALADLWDIDKAQIPSKEDIASAIHKTGFNLLEINKDAKTAELTKEGAAVTLGAVAKGYASKGILDILAKNNISSALVNLGGNTYALGMNGNSAWNIGIQDPNNQSGTIGTLSVYDTAVITSGGYQRYFEKDGVRYHHIINPYTGSPANSGLLSVTIVNDDPILADALSTACFVIGYKESLSLLKDTDSKAVFVTDDNTVYFSTDLQDHFKYDNPSYEYKSF